KSKTKDLLMEQTIPTVTGFSSTLANVGQTASKGIDLSLTSHNVQSSNFQWTTTFNASYQDNKIVALANGNQDDINNGWFIGEPIGVIYGYENDGLWHEEDKEIMDKFNANGGSFTLGNVKPVDQNGDFKIDANNDRVIIGNTMPKWILGMVNNFAYRGFELSVFLYGRMGYKYNTGGLVEAARRRQRLVNYYTEANKSGLYQKPVFSVVSGYCYYPRLGSMNGSFIEVRNISLAYNLPQELLSKWGLSRLKIYVQSANLGMLYSGVDFMNLDVRSSHWNRGATVGLKASF